MHRVGRLAKARASFAAEFFWPARSLLTGELSVNGGRLSADEFSGLAFLDRSCRLCASPLTDFYGAETACVSCQARPPVWDQARAAVVYDQTSRALVLGLKYAGHRGALPFMANWMVRASRDLLVQTDWLMPVPLHYRRLVKRGFNQAVWLAQPVARNVGVKLCVDGLVRSRATESQGGKTGNQRRRNVAGAFCVRSARRRRLEGKVVTLVDDVLTTGSTVAACTVALKDAGVQKVNVLVLARVVNGTHNPI